MSKKINLLNNAEKKKLREDLSVNTPIAQVSRVNMPWIIGLVLVIVFVIVLVVNLKLYSTIRGYTYERGAVLTKLTKIEKILTDNQSEIKLLSTVAKKVVAESEQQTAKISKLEKQSDAQATAIQNLIRAKDTLSNRLGVLEVISNKSKK